MSLFSMTDRKNIMDYIISFTKDNEHIVALVAVGSGAYGFYDELSDLDFVIAVDSDENMEMVMEYVRSQLSKRLNFIYFRQILEKGYRYTWAIIILRLTLVMVLTQVQLLSERIGRCSLINQEQ